MPCQQENDKKSKFVENLEFLRAAHGMSQRDLALALNLSQASISLWLRGSTSPKSSELEKLAVFFSVTMDALWRGEVNEEKQENLTGLEQRAVKAEEKIKKLIPACSKLAESAKYLTELLSE